MKSKILYFGQDFEKQGRLEKIFSSAEVLTYSDSSYVIDLLNVDPPDIIIADSDFGDTKKFVKNIKSLFENTFVVAFLNGNTDKELLKYSNGIITMDFSDDVIASTIEICMRNKKSQENLYHTNKNLASSLYREKVLYDTSSKFAGTLDNEKLIDIMIEGMDKALSFSLTCTLSFCNPQEPVLILNSLYEISEELLSAIKLRTILNYKTLFDGKKVPYEIDQDTLKIVKKVKNPSSRFNFTLFQYDNMLASINQGDEFYGCVEIFKEVQFTTDDSTCFQTIARQVSLPLKSATLYKEIKETNIKLEKLEKIKSDFISIVSHELRTPLTSIKNAVDIVLSGKAGELPQNVDKFLSMAKRNIGCLAEIINDLLDISKIEAGKMDFKFELLNINSVIENVRASLAGIAKEKDLSLEADCTMELPEINGDAKRLEQVLTNLVSNAIKFTENGKRITISSKVCAADDINKENPFKSDLEKLSGDYIIVSVKDEGIGIAENDILRAFDKFAQIENSLSRKVGGTGLGLPIAKQLLEKHNGMIWCESELGKGSEFIFALPLT
ncbi:MAG: HAMP domain-containing histidine kinase [Fusobacterium sp.]|nr:HAMP domain-containing histidine kinase [Fusobacterium sp.]